MSIPESKKCTICKEILSKEFFYRALKDGSYLTSRCIGCSKVYGKQYRINNKDKVKAWYKKHYDINKDKIQKKVKKYRAENKEKVRAQRRENYRVKVEKKNFESVDAS
jgi:hypothetical protein